MKKITLMIVAMFFSYSALAGTVRIYNGDSQTHIVKLKCAGSSKVLSISASTTSSYSFNQQRCEVVGGTIKFPGNQLKDGQSWKVKNSRASQS